MEASALSASIMTKPSSKFIPKEKHKNTHLKWKNSIIFFPNVSQQSNRTPSEKLKLTTKASSNSFRKRERKVKNYSSNTINHEETELSCTNESKGFDHSRTRSSSSIEKYETNLYQNYGEEI